MWSSSLPATSATTSRPVRSSYLQDLLATVQGVDGVAAAEGAVLVNGAQVIGSDGEPLATGGAPNYGANWSDDEALSPFRLTEGRGPTGPGEFALDSQAAESGELAVGDTVSIVTPEGAIESELVGVFRFGTSGNLAGASIAAFTTEEAQSLMLSGRDAYTTIEVQIDEGLTQDEVAESVQAAVGQDATVLTGEEAADEASADISEALTLHQHLPAGLCLHRVVRRRLPDSQHLLDAGRPTHPRARALQGARRQPSPGCRLA